MKATTIKFEVPESRFEPLVTELRESIKDDCGTEYSESVIRNSVIAWLDSRLDTLLEDALERLTSPSYEDARDFALMLEDAEAERSSIRVPDRAGVQALSVFTGNRPFSREKMAAMISHIAARATNVYKTKLNKLLFYADFANYFIYGRSISGSRYIHLPYGPVPDNYEEILRALKNDGIIEISASESAELVEKGKNALETGLTEQEISTLDWVAETYGAMSASRLTELSHRERAYRDTKTGEEIAYEYAKFFAKLPPRAV
jgi:uncharacterized phage-associated protein